MGTELEEMARVEGRSGRSPDDNAYDDIDNADDDDGDDDGELC